MCIVVVLNKENWFVDEIKKSKIETAVFGYENFSRIWIRLAPIRKLKQNTTPKLKIKIFQRSVLW